MTVQLGRHPCKNVSQSNSELESMRNAGPYVTTRCRVPNDFLHETPALQNDYASATLPEKLDRLEIAGEHFCQRPVWYNEDNDDMGQSTVLDEAAG